ncbi:MAG: type II toxin-antitoxin system mRNA interferase toxin, RelE/StbE family [bacterium]|nr:type II toxin-antitoxin system mRNA interferase toxin, RelE/StbE family [bacterium]
MKIYYSSKFEREYKKLPRNIKLLAEEKEIIFRKNPADPRLKTHKLHGHLKSYWSFGINNNYRVIFEFAEKGVVWFHSIGGHSVYQ